MRKTIIMLAAALFCFAATTTNAQEKPKQGGYIFTTVKANPITSIKNQGSSGTCWCFSTTSFLESEAIKNGKADTSLNLSVMYSVSKNYLEKMEKYVRLDGYLNFAEGGAFEDVIHTFRDYGVVQEADMPTLRDGATRVNFAEMTALSTALAEAVKKVPGRGRQLSPKYLDIYKNILETYLGKRFRN